MLKNLTRNALALAVGTALAGSAHAFVVNDTFSGNWAETLETNVARGMIIDIYENANVAGDFAPAALVQWFTYRDGSPVWLISEQAKIDPATNTAELTFFEFSGGAFDPAPGNPQSDPWGTATLKFNSCNNAVLEYDGVDGSGTIDTLTNLKGDNCVVDEVFESCPDFATDGPLPGSCIIGGGDPVTDDITLTNETTWLIQGQFFVGDGGTVTIEPNTEIVGGTLGNTDTFIVSQGGKIFAEGTPENPIIMRGFLAEDRSEWGGLVINGRAPINGCPEGTEVCTAQGEGNSGTYGGNDPHDNSGVMRYLIVSNAGIAFNEEDELNGIALQGVGDGTTFEFIQVHLNEDDGIEFYGGTVNARYLVLTGIGDDSIDWTQGWQGNVQYAVVKQYLDDGDQGIEADNNGDANDSLPRALPRIANGTFIGSPNADIGWLIREGTGVAMANSIVTGFGDECLDIDQESTFNNADNLTFTNNILFGCDGGTFANEDGDPFLVSDFVLGQTNNLEVDPMLQNYAPMPGSPAIGIGAVPFTDAFFDNVDYAGAIPSAEADWTAGWTVGLDRDLP